MLFSECAAAFLEAHHAVPATPKSLAHGPVRSATWVGAGLDETSASVA